MIWPGDCPCAEWMQFLIGSGYLACSLTILHYRHLIRSPLLPPIMLSAIALFLWGAFYLVAALDANAVDISYYVLWSRFNHMLSLTSIISIVFSMRNYLSVDV